MGNIGNAQRNRGNTMSNMGKRRGNGRKHMRHCCLQGFLRHLVTSSHENLYRFIKTEQPANAGESPLLFFVCKAIRNLRELQGGKGTRCRM